MRQAGLLAGAGIYALNHNIGRLAEDHRRANDLAEGLARHGFAVAPPPSNMLYVDVRNGPEAQDALDALGVRCLAVSDSTLRLVTHLDVDDAGVARAIAAFGSLKDQRPEA